MTPVVAGRVTERWLRHAGLQRSTVPPREDGPGAQYPPPQEGTATELLYIRSTSRDRTSIFARVLKGKGELLGFY